MSQRAELWALFATLIVSVAGAYTAIFLGLRAARRSKRRSAKAGSLSKPNGSRSPSWPAS